MVESVGKNSDVSGFDLAQQSIQIFENNPTIAKYYNRLRVFSVLTALIVIGITFLNFLKEPTLSFPIFIPALLGVKLIFLFGSYFSFMTCFISITQLTANSTASQNWEARAQEQIKRHYFSLLLLFFGDYLLCYVLKALRRISGSLDDSANGSDSTVHLIWDYATALSIPLVLHKDMKLFESIKESLKRIEDSFIPQITAGLGLSFESPSPGKFVLALVIGFAALMIVGVPLYFLGILSAHYLGFAGGALATIAVAIFLSYSIIIRGVIAASLYAAIILKVKN